MINHRISSNTICPPQKLSQINTLQPSRYDSIIGTDGSRRRHCTRQGVSYPAHGKQNMQTVSPPFLLTWSTWSTKHIKHGAFWKLFPASFWMSLLEETREEKRRKECTALSSFFWQGTGRRAWHTQPMLELLPSCLRLSQMAHLSPWNHAQVCREALKCLGFTFWIGQIGLCPKFNIWTCWKFHGRCLVRFMLIFMVQITIKSPFSLLSLLTNFNGTRSRPKMKRTKYSGAIPNTGCLRYLKISIKSQHAFPPQQIHATTKSNLVTIYIYIDYIVTITIIVVICNYTGQCHIIPGIPGSSRHRRARRLPSACMGSSSSLLSEPEAGPSQRQWDAERLWPKMASE